MWDIYREVRLFNTFSVRKQQQILDIIEQNVACSHSAIPYILREIKQYITEQQYLSFGLHYIRVVKNSSSVEIVIDNCLDIDKNKTKQAIMQSSSSVTNKAILGISDITLDEEEFGLRALGKSRSVPWRLFLRQYKPRLEVIKRLPPIMRLNAIEALTVSNRQIRYNILENLTKEDLDLLLFPSLTSYPDRVSKILKVYNEICKIGKKVTITISGHCHHICGDYSVSVTSAVIGSAERLGIHGLARFTFEYCPFCRGSLKAKPNITIKDEE